MAKKDKPVFYYDDELNNDFAGMNISRKQVDESFKFIHNNPLWKACSFVLYYLIAWPLVWLYERVILGTRFVNKDAVKKCDEHYFLYGNHTGIIDAYTPNLISMPKRNRIIVAPDTVSIPLIRNIVQMLGAIPLPTKFSGMRKYCEAIDHYHRTSNITIFPEAHIWPYYTGVRPFTDASFAYPVQLGAPVIAFFVAYTKPTGLFKFLKKADMTVYVVSLVSDPQNLTGDETGIMVKGNHNNYMQEWEREAHVEVFDAQGTLLVSQECGVRQQGQTSRAEPQQSLKFVADGQYGSDIFEGKIFSEREDDWCRSFLMRTSNDDQYGARMRDSILTSLAGANDDLLYQKTEVAVAYINGEYWGHYNLRETANEDFICQMEGWLGQEKEFDYVRGNRTLIQGSDETYKNLLAWVQNNPNDTEEAYERITSTVDVKNYLEYLTIQMYVGNTEPSDIKRYRNAKDDGLWRWVLFDLDWGFHRDVNSVTDWVTPGGAGYRNKTDNTLFVACMNNPTIRDQFLTHFGEQLATTFSPESMEERLQERRDLLMTILPDHFERWGGSLSRYERKFGEVVSYAKKRPYKLMMYFKYDETLNLSQADFEKYFGEAMKVLGITYNEIPKPE